MSLSPDSADDEPLPTPDSGQPASPLLLTSDATAAAGMRVPWTLRQVIWGVCLTALPLMLLQIAVQLAPGANSSVPAKPLTHAADLSAAIAVFFTSTVLEAIFLIPPIYHALRTREPGTPPSAALRALGFRDFPRLWTAIVGAGLFLAYLLFAQLYGLFNISTNADALRRQAIYAPYTTVATLLVAVVVAPFCEEVFFRGYVFPPVARALPMGLAILATSIFFGAVHADLGSFVPLVAIGAALAFLRWRSTSIWPGMIFHAVNNGLAAIYVVSVLVSHSAHP